MNKPETIIHITALSISLIGGIALCYIIPCSKYGNKSFCAAIAYGVLIYLIAAIVKINIKGDKNE